MRVVKRSGETEAVSFDKVLNRIKNLSENLNVDIYDIAQKVCSRICDLVKTSELDEFAAHICSSMIIENEDYGILASRIIISNHHKNTSPSFSETVSILYNNISSDGKHSPIVSKDLYDTVLKNREKLNNYIDYSRDYTYDYFGFKTLERSYLLKINGVVVERPQQMLMRVSLGIHKYDFKDALETYDLMSKKYFTHASPTLFNSGTPRPQLSSCFLLAINGDSIDGIFDSLKECAMISKYSGGIGIHVHDVRAKGSIIKGTNGKSDGLIPMLKVFNHTARYVNQCFTPDTVVFSGKGPKKMNEITTDDELVTMDGSYKKVNSISVQHIEKDILKIKTKYNMNYVGVTDEHEIYVLNKDFTFDNPTEPSFILAKDIKKDDYIGYPIPQYTKDMEVDTDYLYFYGLITGYGIKSKTTEYSMTLKKENIDFCEKYFKAQNIKYSVTENYVKFITIKMDPMSIYNQDEKYIKNEYLHLPKEKLKYLLKGLLQNISNETFELYIYNNFKVIESIKYMLLRLGILSFSCEMNKDKCHLRIPKNNILKEVLDEAPSTFDYFDNFEYQGLIWNRIDSIQVENYTGDVYDFNMMDNHNYTVSNLGLVHNSGRRNGSIAVYLEPWHADIYDFLDLKKPHGNEEDRARDLFYSLWIPDLFMERVRDNGIWSLMCPNLCPGLSDNWGDKFKELYEGYEKEGKFIKQVSAQELWFKVLESQIETGTPYLVYKDAANRKSNQQNLGTIKSSNLCVAPETMILTDKGYYPIKELNEQSVNVWNGKEFSQTVVKQTGKMQKLITVQLDNGMSVRCTPYHKFYIETGSRPVEKSRAVIIEAANLKLGTKIIRYDTPLINSTGENLKYAYTQGLFAAEGTYSKFEEDMKHRCNYKKWETTDFCKRHQNNVHEYEDDSEKCRASSYCDKPMMWLYGEKKKLVKYVDWLYTFNNNSVDRIDLALPLDIKEKYYVPVNDNLESKIKWLEGWVDGDGSIVQLDGIKNIQVSSTNKEFLMKVIYMLQTLGIQSRISSVHKAGYREMPDGKGCKKEYYCNETFRINIDSESLLKLKEVGFNPKRLQISDMRAPHHKTNRYTKVSGVIDNNEYDDTYCFNEPKEHKGIFNGILTGQCSEIIEYSSPNEIAICNLASICLPTFIETDKDGNKFFNFEKLHQITKILTKNLNKVIDVNYYPLDKARTSNLLHRPIGIGVQGLADAFILMRMPFESDEARELNKLIFETIYHGSMEASLEISKKRHNLIKNSLNTNIPKDVNYLNENEYDPPATSKYPGAYSSFEGSPASRGQLQFDLWNVEPTSRYDWSSLKKEIQEYGIRNSLLLAPMPTASTSQIMGFNEACEPYTSNIYKRKTMAGEFILINKYLVKDLQEIGLWNKDIKNKIIINEGSIQDINEIPSHIKHLYKIVWEIKQKSIIDLASDRGVYICQSQSMNLFMEDPDFKKLTSMHFYAWQKGLKTGIYYLRTKPRAKPQQFTIDPTLSNKVKNEKTVVCTEEICVVCSS